jgi:hypothetical protein
MAPAVNIPACEACDSQASRGSLGTTVPLYTPVPLYLDSSSPDFPLDNAFKHPS